MDKELDLDPEWKRIQEKTFTRWCNEQLKVQKIVLEDLQSGFSDGVNLIVLLEVLSQKQIGKYNKKPKVHAQKMENVEKALEFITKKERIRLVNIGENAYYWRSALDECTRLYVVYICRYRRALLCENGMLLPNNGH